MTMKTSICLSRNALYTHFFPYEIKISFSFQIECTKSDGVNEAAKKKKKSTCLAGIEL